MQKTEMNRKSVLIVLCAIFNSNYDSINDRNPSSSSPSYQLIQTQTEKHIININNKNVVKKLLGIFMVILVLQAFIVSCLGLIPGFLYGALISHNKQEFLSLILIGLVAVSLASACESGVKYMQMKIALECRSVLVSYLHHLISLQHGMEYYRLIHNLDNHHQNLSLPLDNVDQRVTQDVEKFGTSLAKIFAKAFIAPFTSVYYSYMTVVTIGFIPLLMVLTHFFVFALLSKFALMAAVPVLYSREKEEGQFRFAHAMLRKDVDGITFQNGIEFEEMKLNEIYQNVYEINVKWIYKQLIIRIVSSFSEYSGSMINYIAISIPILFGIGIGATSDGGANSENEAADLATLIGQSSFYCLMTVFSLGQLIDVFRYISDLVGYSLRISLLIERLTSNNGNNNGNNNDEKKVEDEEEEEEEELVLIHVQNSMPLLQRQQQQQVTDNIVSNDDNCLLKIVDLCVYTPNGIALIESKLSFVLNVNQNTLITGPSGCGKSTLIRVLASLWPFYSGKYHFNDIQNVFFATIPVHLPFASSLYEQMKYPIIPYISNKNDDCEKEIKEMEKMLDIVGLNHLVIRCDGWHHRIQNWLQFFSEGEKQRILLARSLYHNPKLIVIDEATNAIDAKTELAFFEACNARNITILAILHNTANTHIFKQIIQIDPNSKSATISSLNYLI